MADNIKISDLDALTAAQNSTIVPVVDGGTTKKMSLSTLQTHLTASFATPTQLSTQISNVNSTISGLTTDDISEGTNLYYTNARVETYLGDVGAITSSQAVDALQIQNLESAVTPILNSKEVISGSLTTSSISDFPLEVSRSAAAAGFGTGGGGGGVDLSGTGVVSSSAQITSLGFISESISASYALTASYALNAGGGGGGTDYISNITLSNSTLTFTGQGSAFNSTINLAVGGGDGGNLLTTDDTGNFVGLSTYETDSGSFATRLDNAGGGSADWNTLNNKPSGIVSSSAQIDAAQTDLTSLTTDDITEGSLNRYYGNTLVKAYLDSIAVVSGSVTATMDFSATNIVSSSAQISLLGFISSQVYGAGTASLQDQIDTLSGSAGVNLNDVNTFLALQKFTQGAEVTGSILLNGGSYSGSGANLYGIPASAIVGGVALSGSSITDGDVSVVANSATGVNIVSQNSGTNVYGNLYMRSGSFSGSGAGLTGIPGSAIEGGVDGQKIYSSSFSASITDAGEFLVNTNAIFESSIYSSGSVTAQSISVGTSGTPTIYSNNNLNLSASNAVVITDSPLRLNPFTNTETGSFSLSNGDLVYNSTTHDFYGYKSGSWVSLTAGGAGSVNWGQIIGIPNNIVSSSLQLGELGAITSSTQLIPNAGTGDILFANSLGVVTSSADFRYTETTGVLTALSMSVGQLAYNTLSGPAAATGSFNLVDADRVLINNDYELPTADGTADQVIKTNGSGITTFGNISYTQLEGVPSGIISSSLQLPANLATTSDDNNFSSAQTISGSLFVTQSTYTDVLVIVPKHPKPTLPPTGSIIVSASSAGPMRPFFFDGSTWTQMFT